MHSAWRLASGRVERASKLGNKKCPVARKQIVKIVALRLLSQR